jgi:hypothetical protein
MYIYPLSRIHNTNLVSAYFGLDKRECDCLEYLTDQKNKKPRHVAEIPWN